MLTFLLFYELMNPEYPLLYINKVSLILKNISCSSLAATSSKPTCDVPSHLRDHSYWRREKSRSTDETAGSRKRQREQESSSRTLEEPPQRRLRGDRSPSPQPSTSAPAARMEGVQLEDGRQEIQPRDLQEDDVMSLPLWPSPYGPQPGGLPHSAYDAAVEMVMGWLTDSPYNPEMSSDEHLERVHSVMEEVVSAADALPSIGNNQRERGHLSTGLSRHHFKSSFRCLLLSGSCTVAECWDPRDVIGRSGTCHHVEDFHRGVWCPQFVSDYHKMLFTCRAQ
ncbi:uncharacterized protein LOC113161419 [Anabas testudineus]|uniref:uncharacterized protein LOC113161419 n=1 Tax=Anabas testudineus TaxID=64144 RepID=UPI000E458B1C|nr:uncharacterized protein LOC113161419 [Anabas testudineus]